MNLRHQRNSSNVLSTHTRRDWLRIISAAIAGSSLSGWMPALAAETLANPARRRACILLWMSGGPSQLDTFDLKSGHENGGDAKSIETSVPGIHISEHLPRLAKLADRLAIVRSMSTKEGDHARGTYLMRTGYRPQGPIHYPTLGSLYSKELAGDESELPNFVSVAPYRFISPQAYGPGFLGPPHAPLVVGESGLRGGRQNSLYGGSLEVANLSLPRTSWLRP